MSNYASRSIGDTSAPGHSSQFTVPDTERGVLPSGYEIAQSMEAAWDCEIDPFYECQILLGTEKQPSHMLIHPEGREAGVVTITGKRKREVGAITITDRERKKRDSNWTKDETSNLITLKKEFASRTFKGRSGWDAIAQKMAKSRTWDQCRRRWETLIKSYQKIKTYCGNRKAISELTQAERAELKLATTISEDWWYDVIGEIMSVKLDDASVIDAIDDLLPLNPPLGTPPIQILPESFEQGELSKREAAASGSSPVKRDFNSAETSDHPLVPMWSPGFQPTRQSYPEQRAIPGFNSMSHTLKCTILHLILAWPTINFNGEMEAVCRWLAIMQDRQPTDTRSFVLELRERDLLTFCRNENVIWLKLGHLQVYSEFAKQAIRTHCYRVGVNNMLKFESMSPRRQTRVLTLLNCLQLERVDLGNFPMLRSLVIKNCPLLETVCGWEKLPELRWLEMDECRSYRTYPEVHCLSSLREARFDRRFSSKAPIGFEPSFSQCVRLSRLEVTGDGYLKESGDLSTLKCLKLLSFTGCEALCIITGMRGLHSLVILNVQDCKSLTSLPGLAYLKSLEELNISGSGVEDITDVEELYCVTHLDLGFCKALNTFPHLGHLTELEHLNVSGSGMQDISVVKELKSLRKLDLSGCEALETVPHLGHLTALAELNVDFTGLEELPGVDMVESLEAMDCYRSQLKWLPALHHLPLLQWVDLRGTPATVIDPSSIYYEKGIVMFNTEVGGEPVSGELSGCELAHFDEELCGKYGEFYPPKCDTLN